MARISVHPPDPLVESLRAAAGPDGSVSHAAAELIRQGWLRRSCEAVAAFENAHDDPEWEAHRLNYGLS